VIQPVTLHDGKGPGGFGLLIHRSLVNSAPLPDNEEHEHGSQCRPNDDEYQDVASLLTDSRHIRPAYQNSRAPFENPIHHACLVSIGFMDQIPTV
jgi:hypothetical protein